MGQVLHGSTRTTYAIRAAIQRIPRVHAAVLAEGDVDAGGSKLRRPCHATPLRVAVVAVLQGDDDTSRSEHSPASFRMPGCLLAGNAISVHRSDGDTGETGNSVIRAHLLLTEKSNVEAVA